MPRGRGGIIPPERTHDRPPLADSSNERRRVLMFNRMNSILAIALCGLALCLLAAPRVHSMLKPLGREIKVARVIFTARADANPSVVAFTDAARTGAQLDGN